MCAFNPILGNQRNIGHLTEAAASGRLSHAYIIEGEAGSGKRTFADFMAAGLLCECGNGRPCGKCPSCIRAASGNHPDIIHVTHKKETVLSIDEVREQITGDIVIKPYYGPYKIYIIADAQLLNANGQNALLKTIEEPPAYGILFFLTDNAETFLDTIRSRCIRLDMEQLPEETVRQELISRGAEPKAAEAAADFARGNLGKALELADPGSTAAQRMEELTAFLRAADRQDALAISQAGTSLEKLDQKKSLGIIRIWFRDVLTLKSTGSGERLYFRTEREALEKQAGQLSYESLNRILEAVSDAEDRLGANVNGTAAFESLFLQIRKEFQKQC